MDFRSIQYLPPTRLLTPADVGHHYGLTIIRLQEWRARGGGPSWHKIGRSCFYRVADLEAFVAASAVAGRPRGDGAASGGGIDIRAGTAAQMIHERLGTAWNDGALSVDLVNSMDALEGILDPHHHHFVAALAAPNPFVTVEDGNTVRIKAGGQLSFTVQTPATAMVDVTYDPRSRKVSSSAGAPWDNGLIGLSSHVFGLRAGRPVGLADATCRLLAFLGAGVLQSLVGAPAPALAPDLRDLEIDEA